MSWPRNADTVDTRHTVIVLDKPYHARFSLETIFKLEKLYGTMAAALRALLESPDAVVHFYSALLGISPDTVPMALLPKLLDQMVEIIVRDFPEAGDGNQTERESAINWDEWYFIARYSLQMDDAEFWNCTPRRFVKLFDMYKRSLTTTQPDTVSNAEAFVTAMGM
jgi:hypothetical protein